ncbi:MAG: DNA processing protein DprA [Rhodomicrobium sp.]|nr:MAG: DNA processing protein DprA [Rhodomicrobium sp.]
MVRKVRLDRNKQSDLFQSSLPPAGQQLSEAQRVDWLRLCRTARIGPVTFRDLLNHFGSAERAVYALEAGEFGRRRFQLFSSDDARFELERTRKYGAEIVAIGEPGYPRWLAAIDGAPPVLTVMGRHELSHQVGIAIVGSRNASATGLKFTAQFASVIGAGGFLTVSGLARGIDTAVHQGSLESGTIAVLGGGIDHIYPFQNEALYKQIGIEGLVISEMPFGYKARAKDFPRRNRIISGISAATVVMEAALRSGSLTTARYAGEQGRDVFAVPGHPLDPRAQGTNKLIQDGAGLVVKAMDVLQEMERYKSPNGDGSGFSEVILPGPMSSSSQLHSEIPSPICDETGCDESGPNGDLNLAETAGLRARLLDMLGPVPIDRDSLTRVLGCSARDLQIALLELDLEGLIEHHGDQRVSLCTAVN